MHPVSDVLACGADQERFFLVYDENMDQASRCEMLAPRLLSNKILDNIDKIGALKKKHCNQDIELVCWKAIGCQGVRQNYVLDNINHLSY